MKKTLIAAAVAGLFAIPAMAQTAAPASDHTFTANVGVVSDYLFRGISQTGGKPAIQGGVDYSHSSGLYAGTFLSSISWVSDAQNRSVPTEIDLYAGFKNTFGASDFGYDLGVITYRYPGSQDTVANGSAKADTTEVYGALSWKFITAKYSYATSDHFIGWYGGTAPDLKNTRGSDYLELNASYDLGNGWGINGHVGHQKVKNYVVTNNGVTDAAYTDWKIGVTKDIGFGVVGLYYSDTDVKGSCDDTGAGNTNAYCWGKYSSGSNTSNGFRNAAQDQVVLTFSKTF